MTKELVLEVLEYELENYPVPLSDADKSLAREYINGMLEQHYYFDKPSEISQSLLELFKVVSICRKIRTLAIIDTKGFDVDAIPLL